MFRLGLSFRPYVPSVIVDSMADTDLKTCAFPGCGRPVVDSPTGGRPNSYCVLTEHNRKAAFAARQAADSAERDARELGDRAVHLAGTQIRTSVEMLAELLTAQRDAVNAQVEAALAGLDTIGDVEQVEAALAATRASAEQEVSAANALIAKANAQERRAEDVARAAVVERDEAITRAEAAEAQREEAAAEAQGERERADEAHELAVAADAKAQSAVAAVAAAEAGTRQAEQEANRNGRRDRRPRLSVMNRSVRWPGWRQRSS